MVIGHNRFTTDLILSENEIRFNNEIFGIWMSMILLNVLKMVKGLKYVSLHKMGLKQKKNKRDQLEI
jgi:hypothetical protein